MTVSVAESPDLSVNPELCYSNDPLSLNFSKQMNEALCKGFSFFFFFFFFFFFSFLFLSFFL